MTGGLNGTPVPGKVPTKPIGGGGGGKKSGCPLILALAVLMWALILWALPL